MDHSTPLTVTGRWADLAPGDLYRPPRKAGEYIDGNGVIRRVQQRVVPHEPGRNEPCPCGSGRKYKKCCLGREL